MNTKTEFPIDEKRLRIRAMVRSAYDLQKLRMQAGLRLCANFRGKLGKKSGASDEDLEKEAKDILDDLRDSFGRLTDGIARNRKLPEKRRFVGDAIISDYTELVLVSQYISIEAVETQQFKQLESILPDFEIYNRFLRDVRGIGPAMAAVILSEIDIHKARYPSSLWRLAGLDVATTWRLRDMRYEQRVVNQHTPDIPYKEQRDSFPFENGTNDPVVIDGRTHTIEYYNADPSGGPAGDYEVSTRQWARYRIQEGGWVLAMDYEEMSTGGRSKRREHLVIHPYVNSKGEPAERLGITYNPFLKTKLTAVLATSFLRANSPYREYYDNYKHRISTDPSRPKPPARGSHEKFDFRKHWTPERIHKAALRYMIKRFLVDLYVKWRTIEGLPVAKEYHEAKHGHVHGSGPVAAE